MGNEYTLAMEIMTSAYERIIRRLWILCIIIFIAFVVTNVGWLYYESQFEDVVTTTHDVTQEVDSGDGGDAVINDGVHINGESKTEK